MSAITAAKAIPTAQLRAHPQNVRTNLGDTSELGRSMRTQGVLQPLLVAPRTVRGEQVFVVIDGHRRLDAARQAQIPQLPCLITSETSQADTLETMLAAAMHERVSPVDQARAFKELHDAGTSIEKIAAHTGYTARTVRDRMSLLHLPAEAQQMVVEKTITLAAARGLAHQARAQKRASETSRENGAKGALMAVTKQAWFARSHPAAAEAKSLCRPEHREARVMVGGVACGQCWEQALRATTEGHA